jgi:hypothetical protein
MVSFSSQCRNANGVASGACANGFGVCCVGKAKIIEDIEIQKEHFSRGYFSLFYEFL